MFALWGQRLHAARWFLVVGLVLLSFSGSTDFWVFHHAGELARQGDFTTIYDSRLFSIDYARYSGEQDAYVNFCYLPIYFLWLVPISQIAMDIGKYLYEGIGIALWIIGLGGLRRCSKLRFIMLPTLIGFSAVMCCVKYGQNSLINSGLMLCGILLLPRRPFLSGAVISLLLYKPQLAAPFLAFLLLRKHGRAVAGWLTGALLQVLATVALWGTAPWIIWRQHANNFDFMLQNSFGGCLSAFRSFLHAVAAVPLQEALRWQWYFSAATVIFAALIIPRARDDRRGAGVAAIAATLYSPYLLYYDDCFLLAGTLLMLSSGIDVKRLSVQILLVATAVVGSYGWLSGIWRYTDLSTPTLITALIGAKIVALLAAARIAIVRPTLSSRVHFCLSSVD